MSSGPQFAQDNPEWAAATLACNLKEKPLNQSRSLAVAKAALSKLNSSRQHAAIAGGYARDMYYGKQPKDIDVVTCTGGAGYGYDFEELESLTNYLRPIFPDCSFDCHEAYGQDGDGDKGDERISCVLQITSSDGVAVDVIWYCDGNSVQDVLNQFDFNINQFAIINNISTYLGDLPVPSERLVQLTEDLTEARIAKVKTKYAELVPNGVIHD